MTLKNIGRAVGKSVEEQDGRWACYLIAIALTDQPIVSGDRRSFALAHAGAEKHSDTLGRADGRRTCTTWEGRVENATGPRGRT